MAKYLNDQVLESVPRPLAAVSAAQASKMRLEAFKACRATSYSSAKAMESTKPKEEHRLWDHFYDLIQSTFLYVAPLLSPIVVFSDSNPNSISVSLGTSLIDTVSSIACTSSECERPAKITKGIFSSLVYLLVAYRWLRKNRLDSKVRTTFSP